MKTGLHVLFIVSLLGLSGSVGFADEKADYVYDAQGKRDPLWSLVGSAGNVISYDSNFMLSDLVLEGIMSGEGEAGIAMINGKIVGVNDKVGQFLVVRIEKNTVVLKKGEETYTLRLKKEE